MLQYHCNQKSSRQRPQMGEDGDVRKENAYGKRWPHAFHHPPRGKDSTESSSYLCEYHAGEPAYWQNRKARKEKHENGNKVVENPPKTPFDCPDAHYIPQQMPYIRMEKGVGKTFRPLCHDTVAANKQVHRRQ